MRLHGLGILSILLVASAARAELPEPGTVVTEENMERFREVLHPSLEYFLAYMFCVPHELRDTIVIESVPTGLSQYAYAKRVLYIDKETFMAQVNEGYDQGGELWKTWYMMSDAGKRPHGIVRQSLSEVEIVPTDTLNPPTSEYERVVPTHGGMVDHPLDHASKWDCPDAYLYPNLGVKHSYGDEPREWNTPDNFTINYLIKSAGF